MSKVVLNMTVSVDGVAGFETMHPADWDDHNALMSWVFPLASWRAQQGQDGGVDSVDSRLWQGEFDAVGPQILGRRMFDVGYPYWGDNPPFHAPVFVLTHRSGDQILKAGGTSYTFVTDGLEAAIAAAREVADGKDILIAGGVSVARQALADGLVDELGLHISPLLLGRGVRLFDALPARVTLQRLSQVDGDSGAVHLRYAVSAT
jgi:dihydrofolate reductase